MYNRVCFLDQNAPLRTSESFRDVTDVDHHYEVPSELLRITGFDPVMQIPIDPMHHFYLGKNMFVN